MRETSPMSPGSCPVPFSWGPQGNAKRRLAVWITAAALLLIAIQTPTSAQPTSPTEPRNQTIVLAVKTPTTANELLANIYYAVQNNLLVQRGLYVDDYLLRLFGGTRVVWRTPVGTQIVDGQVVGFSKWIKPLVVDGIRLDGISIAFSLQRSRAEVASLFGLFRVPSDANFDDVIRVFGKNWKEAPPEPLSPHPRIYGPATHPHGNETILYEFERDNVSQIVSFELNGDASIYIIRITARERN